MDSHFGSTLTQMNYQTDKYGSYGWITNVNTVKQDNKYKLYATNNSTIANGREYIALPINTKITWQVKEQYNLH